MNVPRDSWPSKRVRSKYATSQIVYPQPALLRGFFVRNGGHRRLEFSQKELSSKLKPQSRWSVTGVRRRTLGHQKMEISNGETPP
jgi:hypothetical protein